MIVLHAAAEGKAIRIQQAFCVPNFGTAREDEIGQREQLAFSAHQLWRRAAEKRKLVHAIINDRALIQVTGKRRYRDWIVKPLDR